MKRIFLFSFLSVIFLIFVPSAFAVSVSVSNVPSTLTPDQEAAVNVSVSCQCANSSYYLRGVFFPDGASSSYFGYTYNGTDWYNGSASDVTKFLSISTDNQGSWSGQLRMKLDTTDSSFKGSGTYFLKVARYTSGGTPTWSDPQQITVIAPSPTPSPVPTSSQSSSSTSSTKSPTPTFNTANPEISVTLAPSEMEGASDSAEILGTATDSGEQFFDVTTHVPSPAPTATVLADSTNNTPLFFIIIGILVVIGACGILFYRNWKAKRSMMD